MKKLTVKNWIVLGSIFFVSVTVLSILTSPSKDIDSPPVQKLNYIESAEGACEIFIKRSLPGHSVNVISYDETAQQESDHEWIVNVPLRSEESLKLYNFRCELNIDDKGVWTPLAIDQLN